MSILRALQGDLSQREIGAEMFISLNTVKGYTKSLYRKLDVTSRRAAVQRGSGSRAHLTPGWSHSGVVR